jgi:hypothetical protein
VFLLTSPVGPSGGDTKDISVSLTFQGGAQLGGQNQLKQMLWIGSEMFPTGPCINGLVPSLYYWEVMEPLRGRA